MEDCYYFLYSSCKKNGCEFRHSLQAKNNPILCKKWKKDGECKVDCSYRHSTYHLNKNKNELECYWNKNGKCTKEDCEYKHTQKETNKSEIECYWNKNGKCTKEDCEYKHTQKETNKSEIECYWNKNGKCTKEDCEYKHTQKETNKSEIECYWNKNGKCTKEDCEYKHTQKETNKSEIECYWNKNGKCTKEDCEYKHTQKETNKSEIECYWNKNGKCTKEDCEYKHTQDQKHERKAIAKPMNDAKKNIKYIKIEQGTAFNNEIAKQKLKTWNDKDACVNKNTKIMCDKKTCNKKETLNDDLDIYSDIEMINNSNEKEQSTTDYFVDNNINASINNNKIVVPIKIDEKQLFDESFVVLDKIKRNEKRKITFDDVKAKKCKWQDKIEFMKSNIDDILKKKKRPSLAKIDNVFDKEK